LPKLSSTTIRNSAITTVIQSQQFGERMTQKILSFFAPTLPVGVQIATPFTTAFY